MISTTTKLERNQVLNNEQMYQADMLAEQKNIHSLFLMESAGNSISIEIRKRWTKSRILIICGPGNNGGDGFVVARLMRKLGWPVKVILYGEEKKLTGDIAVNANRWKESGGNIDTLDTDLIIWSDIIVDALFGTGLSRRLDNRINYFFSEININNKICVAVDIPSGISGNTGNALDNSNYPFNDNILKCDLTVTFFRPKIGHLLLPAKDYCGELVVTDIGIPEDIIGNIDTKILINHPSEIDKIFPSIMDHKYNRGYLAVFGGNMPGAAKLASISALRIGSGLVSIFAENEMRDFYISEYPELIFNDLSLWEKQIDDSKINALVLGPGYEKAPETVDLVLNALKKELPIVLDAGAITSFSGKADLLISSISESDSDVVLTPHMGEFSNVFGINLNYNSKIDIALDLAKKTNSTLVLKGNDTIIVNYKEDVFISNNAPPWLATAGSGDVLAGMIGGLLAQGMDGLSAARNAVWIHGEVAKLAGKGMIASDLIFHLTKFIAGLYEKIE